jgi:hypothetical protein
MIHCAISLPAWLTGVLARELAFFWQKAGSCGMAIRPKVQMTVWARINRAKVE